MHPTQFSCRWERLQYTIFQGIIQIPRRLCSVTSRVHFNCLQDKSCVCGSLRTITITGNLIMAEQLALMCLLSILNRSDNRSGKNANRRYYLAQDHSTQATIWRKTDMLKDRVWRFKDRRKRHDFVVSYSHAFGQFQCILLFCFFSFGFCLCFFSFIAIDSRHLASSKFAALLFQFFGEFTLL